MFDSKEQEKKNAHALNNPRVGDIWTEMFANRTYVCDIDAKTTAVKAMLVTGAGQEAFLFATVGDFQDWLMYDTAPVRPDGLTGWTWCDFMKYDDNPYDWLSGWEQKAAEEVKVVGELILGDNDESVKSQIMVFE